MIGVGDDLKSFVFRVRFCDVTCSEICEKAESTTCTNSHSSSTVDAFVAPSKTGFLLVSGLACLGRLLSFDDLDGFGTAFCDCSRNLKSTRKANNNFSHGQYQ